MKSNLSQIQKLESNRLNKIIAKGSFNEFRSALSHLSTKELINLAGEGGMNNQQAQHLAKKLEIHIPTPAHLLKPVEVAPPLRSITFSVKEMPLAMCK